MIKIIRNIQIKRISNYKNLYQGIICYETYPLRWDENLKEEEDLEYQKKYIERLIKDRKEGKNEMECPACEMMERRRRSIDGWER